jgi:hypothetical protein
MRSALFWDFTQRGLVFCYRNFGTALTVSPSRVKQPKSFFLGCLTLEYETDRLSQKSVRNCQKIAERVDDDEDSSLVGYDAV